MWTLTRAPARLCRQHTLHHHVRKQIRAESNLPRIAQPSLWASLIPKPFRRTAGQEVDSKKKPKKDWNPATFFIVISLLIGSNAINMVALKTSRLNYKRETEAKLKLLREVIGKVQRGEEVDVRAELGTGVPEKEKEWDDMMRDLEQEEDLLERMRKKRENKKGRSRWKKHLDKSDEDSEAAMVSAPAESKDGKPGFY